MGNGLKNQRGFSTIELMIALAIMALILTNVVIVAFSNQSFSIGSQTHNEAMKIAQSLLEGVQADARVDFYMVNSSTEPDEGIYKKSIVVESDPDDFYQTKRVKAIVTWPGERGDEKKFELVTLVSNFESPAGANTCNSVLSGDWTNPEIEETIFLPSTISDIDVYKNRLYATANETSGANDPTLFIFDVSDTSDATLEESIDNAPITAGLSAVRVAEDLASTSNPKKLFAYASTATSVSSICEPIEFDSELNVIETPQCAHMYIYDVGDADDPDLDLKSFLKIESSPDISSTTTGSSIFFRNNYVFLGLTVASGPEFHIVDVHNPGGISNGLRPAVGSFGVDAEVNSISAKGNYAYVASPNTQELKIINITSPLALSQAGSFSSLLGSDNGKSLFLMGNKLFLGKTFNNSGNDFHILDIEDKASPAEIGGVDFSVSGNGQNQTANSIIVRGKLAFVAKKTHLDIYDISDESDIKLYNPLAPLLLPNADSSASTEPSMDCEGNRIFISSNNSSGQGRIDIIKPGDE